MATKHDPVRVEIMGFKPTQNIDVFLNYLMSVWIYTEAASLKDRGDHYTLTLITCGYSDNERIIKQLMSSFFRIYWKKSTSSGKHIFKLNKDGSVYFKPLNNHK